jgi:chemotaxis signal transduction protein
MNKPYSDNELLDSIKHESDILLEDTTVDNEKNIKYLICRAGESLFAFSSEEVQEIMLNLSIHYLPFLPVYVRGLINRLGEPFTVVDLLSMFGGSSLQANGFVILKPHVSKMAFLINSVLDIVLINKTDIRVLHSAKSGVEAIIAGYFNYKGSEVSIITVSEVLMSIRIALNGNA